MCSSEHDRSVTHATRGRDGRQEGRECGYYYLHRNLNDSLLHSGSFHYSLFVIHYSLLGIAALVIAATAACSARVDHEG